MNTLIEKLLKESTVEVWGNNPYNGSPEFEGFEVNHEKFAELIVRECATIALREDHDPHDCILSHFGVEHE